MAHETSNSLQWFHTFPRVGWCTIAAIVLNMAETVQNRIQPPSNMSHHMKHIEADVRLTKTRTVDTQSQTVQTQTMLNGLKEAVLLDGDRGRTLIMEPMKQEVTILVSVLALRIVTVE